MALIKCSECAKEISDKAKNCPNCGAPVVAHPRKKPKRIRYFLLAGILIWTAIWLGLPTEGDQRAASSSTAPNTPTCRQDWHKCANNSDLINNYNGVGIAQARCQSEAETSAKYGTPKWPWFDFGTFLGGDGYVKSGVVVLIEKNAQFQNGFGAMVHSTVTCQYDLSSNQVVNVAISPN